MDVTLETMLSDRVRELAKQKDEILFATFEKYGYSREWIENPDNARRISVYGNTNNPDVTIWTVDKQPLFELIEKTEWDGLKVFFEISIRYIAEVE